MMVTSDDGVACRWEGSRWTPRLRLRAASWHRTTFALPQAT